MRRDEEKKLEAMINPWEISHTLADKISDVGTIVEHLSEVGVNGGCYVPFKRIRAYLILLEAEQHLLHKLIEQHNLEQAKNAADLPIGG